MFSPFFLNQFGFNSNNQFNYNNKEKQKDQAPPWLKHLPPTQKLNLHADIHHFTKYIQLNSSEKEKRKTAIDSVQKVIDTICIKTVNGKPRMSFQPPVKPSRVTVYGSEKSNLAFPYSDIDLSIGGDLLEYNISNIFTFISDALIDSCVCEEIARYTHIKVPILKLKTLQDGINIDISFNNTVGIESTRFIGNLCHKNSLLRPLVILIRYILNQGGFTSVIAGGLNTYMITLLVYSFLTMYNTGNLTGGEPDKDLGSVFVTFLQHFGYDFDYEMHGISIGEKCYYFDKAKRGWKDEKRPCMLTIENPLDPTVNLTPNAFLTPQMKAYFAHCLQLILPKKGDEIYWSTPINSRLQRIIHLTEELKNRSKS